MPATLFQARIVREPIELFVNDPGCAGAAGHCHHRVSEVSRAVWDEFRNWVSTSALRATADNLRVACQP